MSIRESVSPKPIPQPLRPAIPGLAGLTRFLRRGSRRRAPWIPICIIAVMLSMALFNILVQWHGLEPDEHGDIHLSIAEFSL